MKIILSPSKTQTIRRPEDIRSSVWENAVKELNLDKKSESFLSEQKTITDDLVKQIQKTAPDIIAEKMKLKGNLLDKVLEDYQNFYQEPVQAGPAALSYTGTVFKELHVENYSEASIEYIHDHVMVLSALYGPIPATQWVQSYRLDMTMALFETSLYQRWKPTYEKWFAGEDLVVDLASKEFSKQINREMITLEFLVWQKGQYKSVPFHSKQGRGLMADFMIRNRISDPEEMKTFNSLGYAFDEEKSTGKHLVFKKEKEI